MRILRTVGWVLRQRFADEVTYVRWNRICQRRRGLVKMGHRQGSGTLGCEERVARKHLVTDHAERIHVAGSGGFRAGRLLR